MEDCIILRGPAIWAEQHKNFLNGNKTTAMQYSAVTSQEVKERLSKLISRGPFWLYVFVPKRYTCGGRLKPPIERLGKVPVLYRAQVIEYKISEVPRKCPTEWPTISGHRYYDMNQSFEYKYWFKVNLIEGCNLEIDAFSVYKRDGTPSNYSSTVFPQVFQRFIAFAQHP
ncbi:MAG: hypothetical protein NTX01_03085 [Candidatus Omnitrophica bacterium]|nr:hypothetical protein [Candidatus Omnitrophota bacterium]